MAASRASFRNIAGQWCVSRPAVERHKAEHLPARLVQAQDVEDVAHAIDVVKHLRVINRAAAAILVEARKSTVHATTLKAMDRTQSQIG